MTKRDPGGKTPLDGTVFRSVMTARACSDDLTRYLQHGLRTNFASEQQREEAETRAEALESIANLAMLHASSEDIDAMAAWLNGETDTPPPLPKRRY